MIEVLVGIAVIAGMIFLIAYCIRGLWRWLTGILGLRSDESPNRSLPMARAACPRCSSPLVEIQKRCQVCGWPEETGPKEGSDQALGALARQLTQFEQLGLVNAEVCRRVADAISAERGRNDETALQSAVSPKESQPSQLGAQTSPPVQVEIVEPESRSPKEAVVATEPPDERPADVATRVAHYAEQRTAAIAESVAEAAEAPPKPPRARRPFTRLSSAPTRSQPFATLLSAFMEEKNIRWGELVGGLLIVCGSIALVISFWSQIAERPFLKFFLFNGVTTALFLAGFYTHKRWKLRTTSQGVLITASLLVPLNFLAIAALTSAPVLGSLETVGLLAGEVVPTILFSVLLFFGARVVLPESPLLTTVGVMMPSILQLLVRRWIDPTTTLPMLYVIAGLPIESYLVVTGLHLYHVHRDETESAFEERTANALLILLGIVSFATAFPLGLLLYKTEQIGPMMHWLSPLIMLMGVPALAAGLVLWRELADRKLALLRTSGLGFGIAGAMVMAVAAVYAWPDPVTLLPIAATCTVLFAVIARFFAIPAAHLIAGTAFSIVWIVVFQLVGGHVGWIVGSQSAMARALVTAGTARALVPLSAIVGGIAAWLFARRRKEEAASYGVVAGVLAALSLVLITWFGYGLAGDPEHAAIVYLVYAAGAFAVARFAGRSEIGWAATVLLFATVVQTIVFWLGIEWSFSIPWAAAALIHAVVAIALAASNRLAKTASAGQVVFTPFVQSTLATSVLALVLVIANRPDVSTAVTAQYLFGVAGVWLALSVVARWPKVYAAFQMILVPAICVAVDAVRRHYGDWYGYHLLFVGVGVAAWIAPAVVVWTDRRLFWHQKSPTPNPSPEDGGGEFEVGTNTSLEDGGRRFWVGANTFREERGGGLEPRRSAARWSYVFGTATVLLALRMLDGDPSRPAWTVGGLFAMTALSAVLAPFAHRRRLLYIVGGLFNLSVSIAWLEWGRWLTATRGIGELVELLLINVLAAVVPVVLSVFLELRYLRPGDEPDSPWKGISFHRFASSMTVWALLLIAAHALTDNLFGGPTGASEVLAWLTVAGAGAAVVACLWDPVTRFSVAHLHILGLAAVGFLVDQFGFEDDGHLFVWALTMVVASYSFLTSYLWSLRNGIRDFASRLGIPGHQESGKHSTDGFGYLVPANLLLATGVTLSAFRIELTNQDLYQRMFVAYAIIAQAFAVGMLARRTIRSSLQFAALGFGVLGAIAFGWAWLPIDVAGPVLHRTVVVAVALAAMIVLYGFGLVKLLRRENEWTRAARQLVPLLTGVAAVAMVVTLGIEAAYFAADRTVPIEWPAFVAVIVALVGLFVASLAAAILPGRDPFGLSDRGRQVYVYAAEVLLTLLFLHIRITMPWLFRGWFLQFWPMIVMAIAFVGVGFSEWFRRRRETVLAEPLERTGALLPLLPVIGYWIVPSETHFAIVLLTVGALYSALSVLRKSFGFAILAVLAANGSLWYLLDRSDGLGLFEHPQLWLIPPALCILAASYANRKQLSESQMTSIRYFASMVIYVSSTADVFLTGVAEAPWLPLVLAGASLAGIFAGIVLRVRAFLYLGTSFLMVSLFCYIWYAAVDLHRTWIWWVTSIVTGVLIIALFAVFEKKRDDVVRLVEELKKWEA